MRRPSGDQVGLRELPVVVNGESVPEAMSSVQRSLLTPEKIPSAARRPSGESRTKLNSRASFIAGLTTPLRLTHTSRRARLPRAYTSPPT